MGFDQATYAALLLWLPETPTTSVFKNVNALEGANESQLSECDLGRQVNNTVADTSEPE